ncbi:MAG TPA: hypothetical protein VGL84_10320 [Gaiellaceae bacterium]
MLHLETHPVALVCIAFFGPCFVMTFLWCWLALGFAPVFTGVTIAVIYILLVAYLSLDVRRKMRKMQSAAQLPDVSAGDPDRRERRFLSWLGRRWLYVLIFLVLIEWLIVHLK